MATNIKRASFRRLASLSALGTGALGIAGGTAYAGIMYSGPIDERVGFGAGYGSKATIAGPNGAGGILSKSAFSLCSSGRCAASQWVGLEGRAGQHGTQFKFGLHGNPLFNVVSAFPMSGMLGTSPRLGDAALVAITWCAGFPGGCATFRSVFGQYTKFSSVEPYLLFEFVGGILPQTLYGWAQLSVVLTGTGPDVTLIDYAYDTSGAQFPAGDTGTGTPEPSTFAMTGLAALALGAVGVRRWRQAAQPSPPREA